MTAEGLYPWPEGRQWNDEWIPKSPRRFGQHFIDVLETCDCVIWGDGAWNLTGLGRAMLAELKSAKEA